MVWKGCLWDSMCLILNAGGCLDAGENGEMHRRKKKKINGIRLQKSCLPRNFQWKLCCAPYREFTAVPGDLQPQEGNRELWCCSCCSVEKGLSLLTDFSSHRKHHVQKAKSCTCLCIHPLVARTRQDPWFSPSHSFAFLPAKLSRADTGTCSSPPQDSPRKDAVDVLDILILVESYKGPLQTTSAQWATVPPCAGFAQQPYSWEWEMSKITAWCQLLSRPPPLPALGWSSSPTSAWPLEHGALCQHCWPCQQQFCRVVFLGTFGLKMTRFLSFERSLLAKIEI